MRNLLQKMWGVVGDVGTVVGEVGMRVEERVGAFFSPSSIRL
jgi:hypothetical protein